MADLGDGVGSEQRGLRPVVIIQNDVGNTYSPTTIVSPITSRLYSKSNLPTHLYLPAEGGLLRPCVVMLEQVRTVDKSRLGKYIGVLSKSKIAELNQALAVSIGLAPVGASDSVS